MAYSGYFFGPAGNPIYPTPRESPGRYRRKPMINREVKRSISQYDHAELVSLSTSICCRIPSLRAAIRDKNSWAFSNWLPIYMGEDEKWGEAAEDYLTNRVLPKANFNELRTDFAWGVKVSGMGLDIHGDDLAVFTENEDGTAAIKFVPSPLIGNGTDKNTYSQSINTGNSLATRADGMEEVKDGPFAGSAIYNGIIRKNGRVVGFRVIGYNDKGEQVHADFALDKFTHYACEQEFFGQGRGLPRTAAAVLRWIEKEHIDEQFMKGIMNASERTVLHQLAPGQDAAGSRGNAVEETIVTGTQLDAWGQPTGSTEDQAVFVERSPDGTVTYIAADENLSGLTYECPHPNVENFAIRVLMECLADLGWSWPLIDTSLTGRAPTRLETSKANNSITERQSIQEIRSVRFFQYAIKLGMMRGHIPHNDSATDPYKWAVGFPAQMSVDSGNDVKSALDMLKMGLTTERIEAAKAGYIAKHLRRQRRKEVMELMKAAGDALAFAKSIPGAENFTFEQAMELFQQRSPNPPQPQQPQADNPKPDPNKK